jgi:hypothetical protein
VSRDLGRRARLLGLDAPSKVEATLTGELVVRVLEDTLVESGIDDTQDRPVLGRLLPRARRHSVTTDPVTEIANVVDALV